MNKLVSAKEKRRIYNKRYRQKIKDGNIERKICSCGLNIRCDYMARHKRTIKHKKLTYLDPTNLIVRFK